MPAASKPLLPPEAVADAELFGYTRQDINRMNKGISSRYPAQLHSALGQLIATLRPGGKVLKILDIGSANSPHRARFLRRNYEAYIDIFDQTEIGWNFDPTRHVRTKALLDSGITYDFVLCHNVVELQRLPEQMNKLANIMSTLTSPWGFCLVTLVTTTAAIRLEKHLAPSTIQSSLTRYFPNVWAAQKVNSRMVKIGDWAHQGANELWICNKMEI